MSEEAESQPEPEAKTTNKVESSAPPERFPLSPGLSIIGLFVTGLAGIIVGINEGGGVPLLASALSFGTVAWIAFR